MCHTTCMPNLRLLSTYCTRKRALCISQVKGLCCRATPCSVRPHYPKTSPGLLRTSAGGSGAASRAHRIVCLGAEEDEHSQKDRLTVEWSGKRRRPSWMGCQACEPGCARGRLLSVAPGAQYPAGNWPESRPSPPSPLRRMVRRTPATFAGLCPLCSFRLWQDSERSTTTIASVDRKLWTQAPCTETAGWRQGIWRQGRRGRSSHRAEEFRHRH